MVRRWAANEPRLFRRLSNFRGEIQITRKIENTLEAAAHEPDSQNKLESSKTKSNRPYEMQKWFKYSTTHFPEPLRG